MMMRVRNRKAEKMMQVKQVAESKRESNSAFVKME